MNTNETKQELMNMMELIDGIKDKIGDGNYLQLCNSLKKVSDKQTQTNDIDEEEVLVWGNDIDINAKYDCVVEFLEPRIIQEHNDTCTSECQVHKPYIRNIHHAYSGIILTGADVSNILFDLQTLGHHNTIDDECTGLSIRLHIELKLILLSENPPSKIKFSETYTILSISYRKIQEQTDTN